MPEHITHHIPTGRTATGALFLKVEGVKYPDNYLHTHKGYDPRTNKPYTKTPSWAVSTREAAIILGISESATRALLHRHRIRRAFVQPLGKSIQLAWNRKAVASLAEKNHPLMHSIPDGWCDTAQAMAITTLSRTSLFRHVRHGRLRTRPCRLLKDCGPKYCMIYNIAELHKFADYIRTCHSLENQRRQALKQV